MSKNKEIENEKQKEEDFHYIREVLNGNKDSFSKLQKRYASLISSLVRKMIKDEDDVEDLTQITFIKAYNALPTFQFEYSFSAWIYRIASNSCIDFLRKRRFDTISINQPINAEEDESYFEIEDNSYLADVNILSEERRNILLNAIEELPANYREIIKMRHEEELEYQDISDQLGIPLGTVKAHLFRARKLLQTSLKKHQHLFL